MSKNSHLKLICFAFVSSVLFLSSCGPWCQKTIILSWFALFLSLLRSFRLLVAVSSVLFLSSCGPWCQKNSHLKLICFASVSCVLFLSSCGPWCQKILILSWFALFLSLLCSFCLLVGLGVKNSHLKLIGFVSVSSVLFLSSCGPWCQKNSHLKLVCFASVSSVLFLSSCWPWCPKTLSLSWFALFLSLLCSFCLLVGLGAKKLSS